LPFTLREAYSSTINTALIHMGNSPKASNGPHSLIPKWEIKEKYPRSEGALTRLTLTTTLNLTLIPKVEGALTHAESGVIEIGEEVEPDVLIYMKGREELDQPLEETLSDTLDGKPFKTWTFQLGQTNNGVDVFGKKKASTLRDTGFFKGLVRVITDPSIPPALPLDKFSGSNPIVVRLYVLRGNSLTPMDMDTAFGGTARGKEGYSDPYIVVELGGVTINDRDNYIENVVDADFYRMFEVTTTMPGASLLKVYTNPNHNLDANPNSSPNPNPKVSVWDRDLLMGDDLIGNTVIDLEDRWYSNEWQDLGKDYADHMTATHGDFDENKVTPNPKPNLNPNPNPNSMKTRVIVPNQLRDVPYMTLHALQHHKEAWISGWT